MELKDVLEIRKMPAGVLVGIFFGALVWHSFRQKAWDVDLKHAMTAGGVVGALLSKFIDAAILKPFIRPLLRRRELYERLSECHRLRAELTRDHMNEVRQKVVLDYLIPKKKEDKDE